MILALNDLILLGRIDELQDVLLEDGTSLASCADGVSPLWTALRCHDALAVAVLARAGATPMLPPHRTEASSTFDLACLEWTVWRRREMVTLLAAHFETPSLTDEQGNTPVMRAAALDYELMCMFLERHHTAAASNHGGQTAVHVAAATDRGGITDPGVGRRIIPTLVAAGCGVGVADLAGRTAADVLSLQVLKNEYWANVRDGLQECLDRDQPPSSG